MGRKRKRKHNHNQKLPPKRPRFWVENCREMKPQKGVLTGAMTVIITRSEIFDDFLSNMKPPSNMTSNVQLGEIKNCAMNKENSLLNFEANESDESSQEKKSPNVSNSEVQTNHKQKVIKKAADSSTLQPLPTDDMPALETHEECPIKSPVQAEKTKLIERDAPAIIDPPHKLPIDGDELKTPTPKVSNVASDDETASISKSNEMHSKKKKDQRLPFIRIFRSLSAQKKDKSNKKNKKLKNHQGIHQHLPNGDCGDGITNPFPSDKVPDKYWAQRKRLFSKFDEGVLLDEESWYSVTPEAIANHLSKRLVNIFRGGFLDQEKNLEKDEMVEEGKIVLDPFCGCGGNSIAFAKCSKSDVSLTVCVDADLNKLKLAANNACIYNIDPSRIIFIHADAIKVMTRCYRNGMKIWMKNEGEDISTKENGGTHMDSIETKDKVFKFKGYTIGGFRELPDKIDAIFLSPPWGGVNYGVGSRVFDVRKDIKIYPIHISPAESKFESSECEERSKSEITAKNGEELLSIAASASREKLVLFYLPRNLDGVSMGRAALKAGYRGNVEMEQNILNNKLKTITVYLGKDNSELLNPKKTSIEQ